MRYKALFIGGAGSLGNEIIKSFFKKYMEHKIKTLVFQEKTDQNLSKSIKKNITLPNHGKIYLTALNRLTKTNLEMD